jgi:pimeloyl-ACP methyl ester carboxylesterase
MPATTAFVRESGQGPAVICLHSNASHSGQWRGLADRLSSRFRVLAVDSYGSGKTADWPSDRFIQLSDEVELIAPVLEQASGPYFLVGHSYGAGIALKAALANPSRVAGLALYEPTLFALLDQQSPPPNGADGIRAAVQAAAVLLDAGDRDGAARCFIDYWMGEGSWKATPAERKPAIAASVVNIRRWAHALNTEPARLEAFRALDIPVLYMTGGRSPRSSLAVADLLLPALSRATPARFADLGHMGPITHPETVNAAIASFVDENRPGPPPS